MTPQRPGGLDPEARGFTTTPRLVRWDERDVMLYALALGYGVDDPSGPDLTYVTENSSGHDLVTLPTYPLVIQVDDAVVTALGDVDPSAVVHGAHRLTVPAPLPTRGEALVTTRVGDMWDKGSGSVVVCETRGVHPGTGEELFASDMTLFIRGTGGWGGDRGPSLVSPAPDRAPDHVVRHATLPHQALLYRLTGDRNPLHADPVFARAAGFPRPILHGACTYGIAARALLDTVCHGDVNEFTSLTGRFVGPVYPGQRLDVAIWETDEGAARFVVHAGDTLVIDSGELDYRS